MTLTQPGFSLQPQCEGKTHRLLTFPFSEINALPELETKNIPAQSDHLQWSSDLCVDNLCPQNVTFLLPIQIFTSIKDVKKIVLHALKSFPQEKLKDF